MSKRKGITVMMRPFRGAITMELLLWIFGTLMAIIFFVGIVYPWLLSIWYGSCWVDARSDLKGLGNEMEGALRGPDMSVDYRLSMGGCIAGVVFVNGREGSNFSKIIEEECSEYSGYKSYMIAIAEEYPKSLNAEGVPTEWKDRVKDILDSLSVWDKIKIWLADKMGRIPPNYCYEFEHDFSPRSDESIPANFWSDWLNQNNWNPGTEPYCLKISSVGLGESDYTYKIQSNPCLLTDGGGDFGGGGTSGDW